MQPTNAFVHIISCIDATELSLECYSEQDAAKVLGFTQSTWDNLSGKEPQPFSLDKVWDELTNEERAGAEALGYIGLVWDTQPPRAARVSWSELSVTEQTAVKVLGYTELSWDNLSGIEVQPESGVKSWSEMTVQELTALEILGYTDTNWDNWPLPLPESAMKVWKDLSTDCGEIPPLTHPPLRRTV